MNVPSNERQILWAAAPGQIGMTSMPDKSKLDEDNTIVLQVLPDIDITALPLEIAISPKATVVPSSGTPLDFSKGPVEYTVTSETGIDRKFKVEVTVFEEIFLGKWSVASVEITSDMDVNYGTPRWPAPGMGQVIGATISHNASTPVYTPVTNGVELDNILTFSFSAIDSKGNPSGILATDPGSDGKTASKQIISDFLDEIHITYDAGDVYNYPDDFTWLPAEKGTVWSHNVSTGTVTFQSGDTSIQCTVTETDNDNISLTFPRNPNRGNVYNRTHNGWYDRYDFLFNVVYNLKRISK